ncbi:bifunctional metallophosphatase/5'-nucleotidase [Haladaptatus salinisoli]|uniref:bifunctional metallophosphatase/5'-nucleotidase n=1 Tax=Haladaptatus salinisoli TaxID=2884876 RepID=UPI001D09E3B2|nr:5'-nucleotidase C-terminal domain-containing protein [Haladaptatus salinisoli]
MALRLLHYSDVENAYDDPDHIGRLAGCIDRLRDDRTLVVGTGDNTSPGVLSLVTEGAQALDFFDAVSPDFETFGNHDFDYGADRAREFVRRSPQTWLTANVRENGDQFAAAAGTVPHAMRELDGTRVGFFGLTDPATPDLNPNATDVRFADPIPAAREAASRLRDDGAEYVVALSHLGRGDEKLAAAVDVDVILGGHVHSEQIERLSGTLLTRPGVNARVLLEIEFGSDPTVTRHPVADAPRDDHVAATMRERMAATGLDAVVATVDDPIERTEATTFRGESRIGNFVADAYRWATDADVGLQNSGGIREGNPLAGEVTVADLVSVVPFQERVAVAELSGSELLDVFRQAHGATVTFGEPDWWHAHLSGVELIWNRAEGGLESATVGGDPVREDATYALATTEYLLHTDREFPALREEHRAAVGDVQYEVLAEYARECGVDPEIDGRIARR